MDHSHRACKLPDVSLPSILEGLAEPAVIIDDGLRIVAANHAYCQHFANGNSVCGKHCYEVSHRYTIPCDQLGESCPLARARASGKRCPALHIHHTSEGEEHESVTVHPLYDGGGRIRFFLEVLAREQVATLKSSNNGKLVGRSPAFVGMLELVSRVAETSTTVLLLGESGTGKDMVARAVHTLSPRATGPFVPLDCSGLTETLFESELFGHEKGSFTGAHERKRGLVEAATDGTLFLDEVGDISLSLQVKLLRLLETGTFRRVGSVEQRLPDQCLSDPAAPTSGKVRGFCVAGRLHFRATRLLGPLQPDRRRSRRASRSQFSRQRPRAPQHAGAGLPSQRQRPNPPRAPPTRRVAQRTSSLPDAHPARHGHDLVARRCRDSVHPVAQ